MSVNSADISMNINNAPKTCIYFREKLSNNMQLFLVPALVILHFLFLRKRPSSPLSFKFPYPSSELCSSTHNSSQEKMWMNISYEWAQLHAAKTVQRLKRFQSFIAKCSFTPLLMTSILAIYSLISSYLRGCGSWASPRLVLTITESVPWWDELLHRFHNALEHH